MFAPYGSFQPSPSQLQIVYVASDGGVTRGKIDFEGVVSWEPLTKGLAIGQAGTIGLSPGHQDLTVAGYRRKLVTDRIGKAAYRGVA